MMTNAEILHCLKTARDNTAKALAEVTPGTDEYSRMLYGYEQLHHMLERMDEPTEDTTCCPPPVELVPATAVPVEPAGHPDPVGEPGDPGEPGLPEPDEGDTEEPDNQPTPREPIVPEELRAALAEAKKKGVVISDLINSLGAKNFSALKDDQDKLYQLKELMEKALKELGV